MSFTADLLAGVAQLLHDTGCGIYRPPSGPYGADEIAITFRVLPASPDRAIALATYDLNSDPQVPVSLVGLQLRVRGARDAATSDSDIDDACFDVLHGLTHTELTSGVVIHQCLRSSAVSMGQDGNRRFERSSNYYLDVHYPTSHRPFG